MASLISFVILFSLILSGLYNTSFAHRQEVTTIKTKYGVYDCVDFYKQPAFDNPLLRNLTSKLVTYTI
ncbi:2S albumin [Bienertia sinuspersici]